MYRYAQLGFSFSNEYVIRKPEMRTKNQVGPFHSEKLSSGRISSAWIYLL